ncbi:FAD-binding domain protein [Ceratobasidium sp. AG-Ba]|nr:FAD-binding domain protein [Ceratobasidium sp. AG-Ba]QRW11630.1 FAD-binding domain protein [Ceratobasidium sp. AG-Ba]
MRLLISSSLALLTLAGVLAALEAGNDINAASPPDLNYISTCKAIEDKVSGVYYFGHPLYFKGNSHWASSSDQNSACVVEPVNANDVSTIIKIIGKTSTPFGLCSGGHTSNPEFSSTPGVQIALFKFNQIVYHPAPLADNGSVGTVEFGSGLTWDEVYAALEVHQVTAVGVHCSGVGVAGSILGGGYSFLTNQYGLAIDNVVEYEIVLPNGTITTATKTHNSDLFFGLKGGFNNFGIVTKFTVLAYPQNKVWGGAQLFGQAQVEAVNQATLDFAARVKDPKASILSSIFTGPVNGIQNTGVSLLLFYDGPTPPAGIFESFASIPHIYSDVSTRSMASLVKSNPSNSTYGLRGTFNTVALKAYTPALIEKIQSEITLWSEKMLTHEGLLISFSLMPFLPSMTKRNKGGAYPHDNFLIPLNLDWTWIGEANNSFFINGAKESAQAIMDQAIADGQDISGSKQIKYPNYSPADEDLKS